MVVDEQVLISSLPANATFEQVRSSLTDFELRKAIWMMWAAGGAVVCLVHIWIVTAMLRKRKLLQSAVNIYLMLLLVADSVVTISFSSLSMAAFLGDRYPSANILCETQGMSLSFTVVYSMWLNSLLCVEVYKALAATRSLNVYRHPSTCDMLIRCLGTLAISLFFASFSVWYGLVPMKSKLLFGLACFPGPLHSGRIYEVLVKVAPWVLLPGMMISVLIGHAWLKGFIQWELVLPSSRPSSGGKDTIDMRKVLGNDVYEARVRRARSITMFFLRTIIALKLWLITILISFFTTSPEVLCFAHMLALFQSSLLWITSWHKSDVRESMLATLPSCCRRLPARQSKRVHILHRESSFEKDLAGEKTPTIQVAMSTMSRSDNATVSDDCSMKDSSVHPAEE
eukprot:scaffold251958_cov38-Tisochrysis_lutea.AAC.4